MRRLLPLLIFLGSVSAANAQFFRITDDFCIMDDGGIAWQLEHDVFQGHIFGTFDQRNGGPAKLVTDKPAFEPPEMMFSHVKGIVLSPRRPAKMVYQPLWRQYFPWVRQFRLDASQGYYNGFSTPGKTIYDEMNITVMARRVSHTSNTFIGHMKYGYGDPDKTCEIETGKGCGGYNWRGEITAGACPAPERPRWFGIKSDVVPSEFALNAAYPNPFNPATTISYDVPESGDVSLRVFDLMGREVASLVSGFVEVGRYDVVFDASSLPSGTYLYVLSAKDFWQSRQVMLLK
jgi:hypothetical protein